MSRYREIADELRDRIHAGQYDAHLPGVGSLADEFQVAINTIRAAEKVLHDEGLVRVAHGERVQILNPPPQEPVLVALAALRTAEAAVQKAIKALGATQN